MKIAVITGASSGIGREFVLQIVSRYKSLNEIWVLARRVDKLKELAKEAEAFTKDLSETDRIMPYIRVIGCDITDETQLMEYKKLLIEKKPSIRVLVNAAGFGMMGSFEKISTADSIDMCELNCIALTRFTKLSLPYMDKKHANIINLASAAAFLPQPSFAVYAATKAYVLSLSRALNRELSSKNICVTAVCPGPVNTEFFDIAEKYESTKLMKKLFRVEARDVVEKALRDAFYEKEVSVYGTSMQLFRVFSKLTPHKLILKFL